MDWISIGKELRRLMDLKGRLKFHPSMDEAWIAGVKQIRSEW